MPPLSLYCAECGEQVSTHRSRIIRQTFGSCTVRFDRASQDVAHRPEAHRVCHGLNPLIASDLAGVAARWWRPGCGLGGASTRSATFARNCDVRMTSSPHPGRLNVDPSESRKSGIVHQTERQCYRTVMQRADSRLATCSNVWRKCIPMSMTLAPRLVIVNGGLRPTETDADLVDRRFQPHALGGRPARRAASMVEEEDVIAGRTTLHFCRQPTERERRCQNLQTNAPLSGAS